jgi:tRNA modification GTPase
VVRISGALAGATLNALAGALPEPRRASLRVLRRSDGATLDQALTLWLPGPDTATGEDLAELHLHGGRAVIDTVLAALAAMSGLRLAEPGEFTRRALLNGRIDLTEAEGLADLLLAETAAQHRQALIMSGGALGRAVADWQAQLLILAARVEALLDFADEDDVAADAAALAAISADNDALIKKLHGWLAVPPAERLRDGIEVVIAGPPNSGKSTLINALSAREVALVSAIAGTTRDIVEVPLALDGIPFRFADTAGLRDETGDTIEAMGIARARDRLAVADLVLWLGDVDKAPKHDGLILVAAQADVRKGDPAWPAIAATSDIVLSAQTGEGMAELHALLVARGRVLLPREGEVALNRRQRVEVAAAHDALLKADRSNALLLAESLRAARLAFDRLTGAAGTESMLDALFGRFCIGK